MDGLLSLGQPEDLDKGSDFLELWVSGDNSALELLCQGCCTKVGKQSKTVEDISLWRVDHASPLSLMSRGCRRGASWVRERVVF